MKPLEHITRIDSGATHCWFVRFMQRGKNAVTGSFSDGVYGGKRKALKAAKEFRDEVQARMKPSRYKSESKYNANTARGSGVRRRKTIKINPSGDKVEYEFWRSNWYDVTTGRQMVCERSIKKHGSRVAKQMVVAAREAGIKKAMRNRKK